ncbi:MAG: hypothetical protein IKY66_07455 [Bacteroidales bacterium]|nr:hypothetical protein [Bacteroidales bacterium]
MTLNCGRFTVEIKAKGVINDTKFNKEDLSLFLSELQMVYTDSANFQRMQGNLPLAYEYLDTAKQIARALSSIDN